MSNRLTTWAAGNTLTAAALNAEFDNQGTGTLSRTSGSFGHNDDVPEYFGSSSDAQLEWDTTQTQDALMLGLSGSNTFIVCEKGDIGVNFAIAASTDPLLVVHSADGTTAADYIALSHNQTNGVITVGAGVLTVAQSATTLTFPAETGTVIVGGGNTLAATGNHAAFTCTDAGAIGGIVEFHHNSASPADSDVIAKFNFYGEDDGSAKTLYAALEAVSNDVTSPEEDGSFIFKTMDAGTLRERVSIGGVAGLQFSISGPVFAPAQRAYVTSARNSYEILSGDYGDDVAGPYLEIGNNTNGSNPNAGTLVLTAANGTPYYLWVDTTGDLRIHTAAPAGATTDTAGTVVGAQS